MDSNYWLHMSANSLLDASWDPFTAQEACEEELVKIAGLGTAIGAGIGKFLHGAAGAVGAAGKGAASAAHSFVGGLPVVGKDAAMGMRAGLKHGAKADDVLARAARIQQGRAANEQVKRLADKRGYALVPKNGAAPSATPRATVEAPKSDAGAGTVSDWWAKRTAGEKLGLGVAGGAAAGAGAVALGSGGNAPKNVNHY